MLLRRSREFAGKLVGDVMAPALWTGTRLRHARVFHPVGTVLAAAVVPIAEEGVEGALAQRLGGFAVVRFSGGAWKNQERTPDLLGCAIRFTTPESVLDPRREDQDLVLATLRLPWTLPPAFLATDAKDFLGNDYYGASPFRVSGLGNVKVRLHPNATSPEGGNRVERLLRAVDDGDVRLTLEFKRHLMPSAWKPLVELRVQRRFDVEPDRLRFEPFRAGRGLRPVGFVQAMRKPAYRISRRAWPVERSADHGRREAPARSTGGLPRGGSHPVEVHRGSASRTDRP